MPEPDEAPDVTMGPSATMAPAAMMMRASIRKLDGELSQVLADEHEAIGRRRALHGRNPVLRIAAGGTGPDVHDTVGLALSGGGIRCAAFCLGVTQALEHHWGLERLDYLSTVSGGGYLGASITASMSVTGQYPFGQMGDVGDAPAVGHLRNFSNYLLPRGEMLALWRSLAVVLRGLVANVVMTAGAAGLLALVMVLLMPLRADLLEGGLLSRLRFIGHFVPARFGLSLAVLPLLVVWLVGWALWRATARPGEDVRGAAVDVPAWLLLALIGAFLLDLQPLALEGMFRLHEQGGPWAVLNHRLGVLSVPAWIVAAGSTLMPFFAGRLTDFLRTTERGGGAATILRRVLARLGLVLAAAVVPLLAWAAVLGLAWHGIADDGPPALPPHVLAMITAPLLVIIVALRPNANSLHALYRNRLSKAFLFDPRKRRRRDGGFRALERFRLSQSCPPEGGPYHLVNAALNLQGSRRANQRGRNADFFLFSPLHVGAGTTGYVKTRTMERLDPTLTLGSAMAISGAAASSDMGARTNRLLAPTLALLNIRLGYWMDNPRLAGRHDWRLKLARIFNFYLVLEMLGLMTEYRSKIYLTDGGHIENLGLYQLLKRGCRFIVAVDGEADPQYGFESLMILQRFARIDLGVRIELPWQGIAAASLAVDARMAALGAPAAEAMEAAIARKAAGPHCALGLIRYPNGEVGHLLYIKASMSGDEHDTILDYKRRHPDFPHETTGDQFFSEEQFEAYRALGYHAAEGPLTGSAVLAWTGDEEEPDAARMLQKLRRRC